MALSLGLSTAAFAEVEVSVDPPRGTADDSFQLKVTVSGESLGRGTGPQLSESSDFTVTSQGRSSRITIINGQASQDIAFTFEVTPRVDLPVGKYQLPSITVPLESGVHIEKGPVVEIVSGSAQAGAPPAAGSATGSAGDSDIQFSQTVSSSTPYVGEQVQYKLSLQTPGEVIPEQVSDFSAAGMWKESLKEDRAQIHGASPRSVRTVNEDLALFPTQSGEQQIGSRTLRAQVPQIAKRQRSRSRFPFGGFGADDFFSDFFLDTPFVNLEPRRVTAPAIKLNVKPLPPPPQPGLGYIPVGKASLASSLDREHLEVGETSTLKVELYGDANLRPLNLTLPATTKSSEQSGSAYQIYPGQPNVVPIIQGDRVFFKKTFQFAIVPAQPGKVTIPSLQVITFDPEAETYRTLTTPERTIEVTGEAAPGRKTPPAMSASTEHKPQSNQHAISEPEPQAEPTQPSIRTILTMPRDTRLPKLLVLAISFGGIIFFARQRKRETPTAIDPAKVLAQLQRRRNQLSLDETLQEIKRYGELLGKSYSCVPEELIESLALESKNESLIAVARTLRSRIERIRYAPTQSGITAADNALPADIISCVVDISRSRSN